MSYIEWVKNCFRKLERDFLFEDFKPQNESTINAHLYYYMLQNKLDKDLLLITDWHTEELKKRRFIDLAIVRVKKNGEEKEGDPLLLVEIKEAGTNPSPEGVMKRIKKDVEDLTKFEEKGVKNLVMIFFYRNPDSGSISNGKARALEKEFKNNFPRASNVVFLFGPRNTRARSTK